MTGPTSDSAGRPVAAVVVTTHDRPELARRAVLSALTQTVPVEVVVVDDGSEPPFVDPRVRVVRTEGVGVCAARNRGLAVVDAPWVCFLDDDDELVPDALARALAAAATSDLPAPVAVLVGVEVLEPGAATGRVLCGPPALRRGDDWFLDDPAAGGRVANGLVVETAVLRAIGGFDERLRSFEHDDLGLRLNAVASVVGLDVVGYRMHSHAGPRLSARAAEGAAAMELTLAEHRRVFARHRHAHARYLARLAFQQVEAGRWAPALRWAARGVVRDPADHRTWRNLGVALAGPRGLAAFRRLSPPESTVPFSTLTARRIVKHTRPARDLARAAVGLPAARLTRVLVGRHVPPAGARPPRRALLCCVYRERNADVVARLAADATARGWSVRLWALDAEVPALAAHTVGVGPGTKFALLDRLLTDPTVDPGTFDWFVVADDDVEVDRGSIDDLLALAEAGRLDLVQPAHTERSHRELEFTVRRPVSVARRTTFVEIGPIFAFRRELLEAMVPFPVGDSMGWGLELSWFDLERAGARLGIVDAAAVRHLHPVGADYAKQAERRHLQGLLDERGLTSVLEIQKTRGVWRPWRSGPPWT